ncbi:hypothetical protein ACWGST_09050 [Agromyces sp. NPDC055520]
MTDQQPTAEPTVFRAPTDRLREASGAQTTMLVLGIVVGGGFAALAVWTMSGRSPDAVVSLVFGLGGLGILIAAVAAVFRWRRNLRQAVGVEGVAFTVDAGGLSLGAFGRIAWQDVAEIVFKDRRPGDGGGFQGTPAAYGRRLGVQLRKRGGKSEMDVLVTLRGGARRSAVPSDPPVGAAAGMSSTKDGRTVVRLPFGAALPVEAFHDAYRAVEPVAAAHGVALRYDDSATA